MKLARLLFLLALLASPLFHPSPTQAQTAETWYWAWENETGQLLAYTYTGANTPLLLIEPDIRPKAWRLGPDRALAVLSVNGAVGLYELGAGASQAFSPRGGAEGLLPAVNDLAALSPDGAYAVLVAQDGAFQAGLLVDLAAKTVEALSGEAFSTGADNWRFSADSSRLRYFSRAERESTEWALWDRDLAGGDELRVTSFSSDFPAMRASADGEAWIYTELQTEPRLLRHVLVRVSDGSVTTLAQQAVSDPITTYTDYLLLGSTELRFSAPCSANCRFEQLDLSGNLIAFYDLPQISSPQVRPLAEVDIAHILALIDNTYWLLDNTQVSQALGTFDGTRAAGDPADWVSPDRQHTLGLLPGDSLGLWNLGNGEQLWTGPAGQGIGVVYSELGAVITQDRQVKSLAYRWADGASFDLPHLAGDYYGEWLNDGTVVYVQTREAAGRPAGIYRYNPADGAFILMLQNYTPLLGQ
jgi:hypothetical protein